MHYTAKDKLVEQSLAEIDFAYQYKQGRIAAWNATEDMLYEKKVAQDDTRTDIALGGMDAFVETFLSKIDTPLTFKYTKGENADLKKAKILNALKDSDSNVGRWDFKDTLGKKDAIKYGRSINLYYAESSDEYKSVNEPIDPKDFLIDPSAGGLDIEKALYMGWWNTRISRQKLSEGAKNGIYIKSEVKELLLGDGNNTEQDKQDLDKKNRFAAYASHRDMDMKRTDMFKFYTWITTSQEDGRRYYLILNKHGQCIRCQLWSEIQESDLYPIWTWASKPEAYEFWTLAPCDYAREILLGQKKSIGQTMDNSEKINEPMKALNTDYVDNLDQIKYRKSRIIQISGDKNINDVYQTVQTPSIDTPLAVYDKLDTILQAASGVTAATKGTSEEDLATIYQGNLEQVADRFKLLNKSYSEGYYRLAVLYKEGVMQHLKKKTAVMIIGEDGLSIEEVTKKDLKPSGKDYDVLVESSTAEAQLSANDQKNRIAFLSANINNKIVNQKVLFEQAALAAGMDEDSIKALLDNSDYSTVEVRAQADEDFQKLLKGKLKKPYRMANTAYAQRILDLTDEHYDELKPEQIIVMFSYLEEIMPLVMENMTRSLAEKLSQQGQMEAIDPTALPNEGAPGVGMEIPQPQTTIAQ